MGKLSAYFKELFGFGSTEGEISEVYRIVSVDLCKMVKKIDEINARLSSNEKELSDFKKLAMKDIELLETNQRKKQAKESIARVKKLPVELPTKNGFGEHILKSRTKKTDLKNGK